MSQPVNFQLFPSLTEDEYEALKADIARHGVLVPVEVDEDGNTLDGHHRVRAWAELRAEGVNVPDYPRTVRTGMDDDAKVEHVLTLNLARRHLTPDQRRELETDLRQRGWSFRRIAKRIGVDPATVHRDLTGVASATPDRVQGADGKSYQSNRPDPAEADDTPDLFSADEDPAPSRPLELAQEAEWSEDELALRKQLEEGETVTVNLRSHGNVIAWAQSVGRYERIDRRTDWGNHFEIPGDGDRATVIRNYADHYLPHKPSLLGRIGELQGKALGCWCAPEWCHGDILKAEVVRWSSSTTS